MYEFIQILIYEQNYKLLKDIANNKYNCEEDRDKFLNKYHKKNYSRLIICKKNNNKRYEKNILRLKG